MFESDLNYCPECKDEYRAEIRQCATCECQLVPGQEMEALFKVRNEKIAGRLDELTTEDDLVLVRMGGLSSMKELVAVLNREGIATLLAGDEQSCGKGCCPGNFDLLVREEDAAEAVNIIDSEIRRTAVIDVKGGGMNDAVFDPLSSENTCPACGHSFSGGTECPDCGLCF